MTKKKVEKKPKGSGGKLVIAEGSGGKLVIDESYFNVSGTEIKKHIRSLIVHTCGYYQGSPEIKRKVVSKVEEALDLYVTKKLAKEFEQINNSDPKKTLSYPKRTIKRAVYRVDTLIEESITRQLELRVDALVSKYVKSKSVQKKINDLIDKTFDNLSDADLLRMIKGKLVVGLTGK